MRFQEDPDTCGRGLRVSASTGSFLKIIEFSELTIFIRVSFELLKNLRVDYLCPREHFNTVS